MKRLILMLAVLICASSSFAYYNSEQGRWLNRDPIGEAGGKNLVGFLNNCALNKIDLLGWSDNAPGGKCYVLIRVSHGMSHGRNNNNEKYGKDVAVLEAIGMIIKIAIGVGWVILVFAMLVVG